jgi:hypothetical protein
MTKQTQDGLCDSLKEVNRSLGYPAEYIGMSTVDKDAPAREYVLSRQDTNQYRKLLTEGFFGL